MGPRNALAGDRQSADCRRGVDRGGSDAGVDPAQVAAGLTGRAAPEAPVGIDFIDVVSGHYEAMLVFYGSALGAKVARKHLGWYMDEASTSADLRSQVLTCPEPAKVLRMLPEALAERDREARAA